MFNLLLQASKIEETEDSYHPHFWLSVNLSDRPHSKTYCTLMMIDIIQLSL